MPVLLTSEGKHIDQKVCDHILVPRKQKWCCTLTGRLIAVACFLGNIHGVIENRHTVATGKIKKLPTRNRQYLGPAAR